MSKYNRSCTLTDIARYYHTVLVDSSILTNFYESSSSPNERYIFSDDIANKTDSTRRMEKITKSIAGAIISNPRVYLIPEVIDEMLGAKSDFIIHDYKVLVNLAKSRGRKDVKKFLGVVNRSFENNKRLARICSDDERVLNLTEDQEYLYCHFYQNYFPWKGYYELSDTDFKLLCLGAALACRKKEKASLLTNDKHILYAWANLLKKRGWQSDKFGAFPRKSYKLFIPSPIT